MAKINFWKNKRVFVTGHTGFKGSWLCLWLSSLGADVVGYALKPPTTPSLFELANIGRQIDRSVIADIRDLSRLKKAMAEARPEIVIHMAAQPLVRDSYSVPVDTFEVNVLGTVNLLEAVRHCPSVKAVVNVTTDKVYENDGRKRAFREADPLGGHDPYSTSKACSELVSASYRRSFFADGPFLATARAGNVIGGGDWATDRLVPDFLRSALGGKTIMIRNPEAVRPWQHVLDPLSGYLKLAERLYTDGSKYVGAWNFGPNRGNARTVETLIKTLCKLWDGKISYQFDKGRHPHEAHYLFLDNAKAKRILGWKPKWDLDVSLRKVVEWTRSYKAKEDLKQVCLKQIKEYSGL